MEVEFDIATDGITSGARRVHDSTDRSILRTLYGVRPGITPVALPWPALGRRNGRAQCGCRGDRAAFVV